MGALHWSHLLFIGFALLLLFGGRGKLSSLMGDAAKGVKAFRDGLKDSDQNKAADEQRAGALPRTDAEKEDLKQ